VFFFIKFYLDFHKILNIDKLYLFSFIIEIWTKLLLHLRQFWTFLMSEILRMNPSILSLAIYSNKRKNAIKYVMNYTWGVTEWCHRIKKEKWAWHPSIRRSSTQFDNRSSCHVSDWVSLKFCRQVIRYLILGH
jgi:hypothetical protein